MAEVIYKSSTASLLYDKTQRLITLEYQQEVTSDEYREMFSNLVEFARKNSVDFFMSDLRKKGRNSLEDLQWLDTEVLKIADTLGIYRVALISEETLYSTIYAETIKRKLSYSPIEVQLFTDPESAKSWILG